MNKINEFLTKIYQIENEHHQVDEIYDFMDDHLRSGNFAICSEILEQANPALLAESAILSFLIVTRRAKELTSSRMLFSSKADNIIENSILKKYT